MEEGMNRSALRTLFVILGMFVLMTANGAVQNSIVYGLGPSPEHFVLGSISVALSLYGYYLWATLKGRHWAWMFLALAAPITVVPIAILKDRKR